MLVLHKNYLTTTKRVKDDVERPELGLCATSLFEPLLSPKGVPKAHLAASLGRPARSKTVIPVGIEISAAADPPKSCFLFHNPEIDQCSVLSPYRLTVLSLTAL